MAARWPTPATIKQALDVLSRAHTPDQPDWRILSAQGAVLDQMGRHAEAQRHYSPARSRSCRTSRRCCPISACPTRCRRTCKRAEATLRRAVAQPDAEPKVRQNLALVVGLQGRFAEAEKIASADLPPDEAAANVAYLRQMLAQQNDWKKGGQPYVPPPDAGT